jgi:hypothetical protein
VATDPRRLARLMARHDPASYPGKYVTCIHSHAGHGSSQRWKPAPDLCEEQAAHNARLCRENTRLADQLEAALGHLRRLTIDNAQLRHDLEAARAITRLDPAVNDPN